MSNCRSLVVALAGLAIAPAVLARDIHYGAVADPAVLACDDLHWHGNNAESSKCYANLLGDDSPAAAKAEASWALNNLKQANEWFRVAVGGRPAITRPRCAGETCLQPRTTMPKR